MEPVVAKQYRLIHCLLFVGLSAETQVLVNGLQAKWNLQLFVLSVAIFAKKWLNQETSFVFETNASFHVSYKRLKIVSF